MELPQILKFAVTPVDVWDFKLLGTPGDQQQWPNNCDVDFSPDGTTALIGNLNGVGGSTSIFLIANVELGQELSAVTPAKLEVPISRHIHNVVFRFVEEGGRTRVYGVCLFWNPGGYAVFERVENGQESGR